MKVTDTEQLYKKRKNIKDYLTRISPGRKSVMEPKPLCVAINRIPPNTKSSHIFKINIYKIGFLSIEDELTPKEKMQFLIAKFKFIANTIEHNIGIASENASEVLLEDLKDSITCQLFLNQIKVPPQNIYINNSCNLKHSLIEILDPNSNQKINNIKSLTATFNEIKSHELCTDELLEKLTQIYQFLIVQSNKTINNLRKGDISLDELFESCLNENKAK